MKLVHMLLFAVAAYAVYVMFFRRETMVIREGLGTVGYVIVGLIFVVGIIGLVIVYKASVYPV